MSVNLKSKTVLFIENGLFSSFCRTVAKEFGNAYYWTPWEQNYPKKKECEVGSGYPEMERIRYWMDKIDEVDLFVFPDIYHADKQIFLRSLGARVWGPAYGEDLELYRWAARDLMLKKGMPVSDAKRIIGMDDLRTLLMTEDDKFIKASFYRGDFETFHHENYWLSKPRLDQIEYDLGPLADDFEFIVEDPISDAVEVGYDGYCVDGEFPSIAMQGFEIKEMGMVASVMPYEKLSAAARYVNGKFSDTLKDYKYRGLLSTEIRVKDDKAYMLDFCCRAGSPSNELLQRLFSGWGHVMWYGAEGICIDPVKEHEFGVCAMVHCEESEKHWEGIEVPKAVHPWVIIRNAMQRGEHQYAIPLGDPSKIAAVVGVGSTLLEAIAMCKENAGQIKPGKLEINMQSLVKGIQTIEKGEKEGISFSSKPLPTADEISAIIDE